MLKFIFNLLVVVLMLSFFSCGKETISPDAVDLSVDFTWEGMVLCDIGNPKIRLSGVPEQTKFIKIHMYDHAYQYDHGDVTFPFSGSDIIERGKHRGIQGPCPTAAPGLYEITIKALDEKKVVIGIGKKERPYPE